MEFILYVVLAIVILLLMIVIHELGHYLAGKLLKFKINEFSIGFGPKLFSKKKKNGEVFSLRLIPLGGYCAFEGETDDTPVQAEKPLFNDNANKEGEKTELGANAKTAKKKNSANATNVERVRSFNEEKPWKRIIVLISGGLFNLISAVIFSFIVILVVGYAVPRVDTVYYADAENTVPYCQLQKDDKIVTVNGKKVHVMNTFEDLTKGLGDNDTINVTIIRGGQEMLLSLRRQVINTIEDGKTLSYTGFGFKSDRVYENGNLGDAFIYSVPFTAKLSWTILGSFFDLITGQLPITSITGPIGTVGMMAELSALNWRNILLLLPLIASNLGLFNLLPIPALDGSKVVFTGIEWIRKKPINRKVENYIHTIGLFVLFALVIVLDIVGIILR